jgi:hypothetical protein
MAENRVNLIVTGLEQCRAKIDVWETKPVGVRDTPEFRVWEDKVADLLRLGGASTAEPHVKFMNTDFRDFRPRLNDEDIYDSDDQQEFLRGLALTRSCIDTAIRNLKHGLQYEAPQTAQRPGRGDVNVNVNLTNVTVVDVFTLVRKRVESLPADAPQRKSLLDKLDDIARHPLFNTLASIAVGQLVNPGTPPKT